MTQQERVTYDEWMSEADAVMWQIERDPLLRSTVTSVWVLDQSPDRERFDETLRRAVQKIPRLRQRAVADRFGLAPPRWEDDPHFDAEYHVRRVRAGGEGTLRDLLDLAEPIAMQAFDKDRPLWEFHLVDGMAEGRSGVVMKLHHAVSDGMGLVRMTERLVERSREPRPRRAGASEPEGARRAEPRSEGEQLLDALRHRLDAASDRASRMTRALGRGALDLARDPAGTVQSTRDTISSLGRLLRPVSEPMSPLMTGRSLTVHFDALAVPLDELKLPARAVGGTVNDAFVAAVAGGLRRYHEELGRPTRELRMSMPINVREGEKATNAGNQFVPARFAVPITEPDPAERMRIMRGLVSSQRAEPALGFVEDVNAVIGRLGGPLSTAVVGSLMKALDFVTSNVPGPRFPVYASGARIENMFPYGPLAGSALNVTLFSYDGVCQIGANMDPAAVTEPDLLMDCLRKGFGEIATVS